jgi:PA-IL-like protein
MRHIIAATFVTLCLAAGSVASAAEVTFVLTNGDRHTGQLFYDTGTNVGVIVNGQKRMFPVRDIAVIQYAPGDPSRNELEQINSSPNPPELERHTLVLRDGRVLKGKVYHWESDTVTFDTTAGRAKYHANDVARLFLNGQGAKQVFNHILNAPQPAATDGRGRGRGRGGPPEATVRVEANRTWTDTGLVVRAGEPISFSAQGTVTFGANMTTGPDGDKGLPPNRNYPVPSMSVGGLIGRVGNGRPFPIGSTRSPIEMPNDGRLFLGVNDDQLQDNSDGFDVAINRR